ncbi:hypothetical protein [Pseudobutyrivibrio xylanivorans]|uniref:Uncharacterized protein n=1 Tax=Pseudobutyrivibrio xylanivorans DSM 14809 TaxID=1123012 RepID=A0A1M6JEA2_PSEXY|nr:hypothetical protein [Pseudobutyrivibrio xylanivorans]SHJ45031.1 hypothetical protein SAMN02745725_02573 [Pseudobutyrivibrio xylanivorans DSM 14809]
MIEEFHEICNVLVSKLNSRNVKISRDVVVEGIALANPVVGVAATGANSFLDTLDNYLLSRLLMGLSSGLNQEKQINDLYNFVKTSEERAFLVGTIFKQTMASQSPKACVVMGKILANHIGDNESDFTRDEIIALTALANATDYDLESFSIIMRQCVKNDENGAKRISYNKSIDKIEDMIPELNSTCAWCTYNRLFTYNPMEWGSFDGEKLIVDTHYKITASSEILIRWIDEVKQIWDYGK